ncbi:TIGR04222 domain-containing membrane protein [Spirillospora sp. NPDC048911]|uniref:TIGR04222 domain-containing membrane protein n=1 Tax=Spirillospora sp. NPDC048911 TaxID=3364527 RepID=UPI003722C13A
MIPHLLYFGGSAVALLAAHVTTSWLRRGHGTGRAPDRPLHPYEVAYINGGPRRVVGAALAGLRMDGVVAGSGGGLQAVSPPRKLRTPLDVAIHHAIASGAARRARDLPEHPAVRAEVEVLRAGLERQGLAPGAGERTRMRLAVWPYAVAFLVIGMLAVTVGDMKGFYVVPMFAAIIFGFSRMKDVPRATRSGRDAVADTLQRNSHLDPGNSPAWTTYGTEGAALGAALFGAAALVSIDPGFATDSGASDFMGSGSGDGGSGGCGASCGSSCGGSSCGGSGCGGGGCGGGGG